MPVTSPDNLWSPNPTDPYNLTQDLAQMQTTVQDALSSFRGSWINLTPINGFTSGSVVPAYKLINGTVFLSGELYRATTPSGTSAFILPVGARPRSAAQYSITPDWELVATVFPSGDVQISANTPRTTGSGYRVGSISFAIA